MITFVIYLFCLWIVIEYSRTIRLMNLLTFIYILWVPLLLAHSSSLLNCHQVSRYDGIAEVRHMDLLLIG
jgi:hypothetical protein